MPLYRIMIGGKKKKKKLVFLIELRNGTSAFLSALMPVDRRLTG